MVSLSFNFCNSKRFTLISKKLFPYLTNTLELLLSRDRISTILSKMTQYDFASDLDSTMSYIKTKYEFYDECNVYIVYIVHPLLHQKTLLTILSVHDASNFRLFVNSLHRARNTDFHKFLIFRELSLSFRTFLLLELSSRTF